MKEPKACARDVSNWHLADVQTALMNVRFEGNNRHDADATRCLLMTQSGHLTACDPDRGDNDIHASLSKRFRRLIRETQESWAWLLQTNP